MRRTVFRVVLQYRFVVLSAVENSNDEHLLNVHSEGDHGAFLVVGDAQAGPNIIAHGAALAVAHDSLGVPRCYVGDVAVQGHKLFLGLRGEGNAIAQRALACSAARRVRTWSTVTAREGSALSES